MAGRKHKQEEKSRLRMNESKMRRKGRRHLGPKARQPPASTRNSESKIYRKKVKKPQGKA